MKRRISNGIGGNGVSVMAASAWRVMWREIAEIGRNEENQSAEIAYRRAVWLVLFVNSVRNNESSVIESGIIM